MTRRELLGWDGRSAVLFGTFYARPERDCGGNRTEAKGGGPLDTSYLRRLLPILAAKARSIEQYIEEAREGSPVGAAAHV